MSKLAISTFIQAYSDSASSNAPSLNNVRWARDISAAVVNNPLSEAFTVAPGETRQLWSGTRTLLQDNTTHYSISLKPLSSNTYILSAVSGTLPNFRTPRSTGADATTQVTVTVNGPVVTFTSTGGTNFNLAGAQVGDFATVGSLFNPQNQGTRQIIALTATSFSVKNDIGAAEGPITLGAGFASQIQIFSAAGVQVGDTLVISGGFSLVTQGSYKVTAVYANSLEFYFSGALPQESNIQTQAIAIYSASKQLIYMESDSLLSVILNGAAAANNIEPFIVCGTTLPGIFMLKSTIYSVSVTNPGINTANVMLISVE